MPLSATGEKVKNEMMRHYGAKKGKQVFYASENKGIPGSSKWTLEKEVKKRMKVKK